MSTGLGADLQNTINRLTPRVPSGTFYDPLDAQRLKVVFLLGRDLANHQRLFTTQPVRLL